jgi:RimJ/RimL family protein N-acetyltransferase
LRDEAQTENDGVDLLLAEHQGRQEEARLQHIAEPRLAFDRRALRLQRGNVAVERADADTKLVRQRLAADRAAMAAEIDRRLGLQAAGTMLPFTVIERATQRVVGVTTYLNIDLQGPRLEIGATWYAKRVQRTPLNTEAKLLLLSYAFDRLDCLAVEFRTHFLNHQSRRAIERLGAKLDGILRQHLRMRDGTLRDTCVYSIIASEWPAVRSGLNWQLEKTR